VLATKPSRAPRIVAINGSRRSRRPRS
jgi:hypothetical protein